MHPELHSPEAVRSVILEGVAPLAPHRVPLEEAAACVLAEPLVAGCDLPPFSNSAMDGYAVRSADIRTFPSRLRLAGRTPAGCPAGGPLEPGTAWAVATGAPVPAGADAVVALEETTEHDGWVEVAAARTGRVEPGLNVRPRGSDVRAGDVVLTAGTPIGPGQLAAAAALGAARVAVHRRPFAAILPTGDEVRQPGTPLGPGQVHDAVSVPLEALLAEAGARTVRLGVVADRPEAVEAAVRKAAATHDVVVTVGGVSVGARDFVAHNTGLPELRTLSLALRPARPFGFGRIGAALVLCLPGNPASAFVAFEELVRPAVLALAGRPPHPRPPVTAIAAETFTGRLGKTGLVGCTVWRDGPRLVARRAGVGGGMMLALAGANAWAVLPPEAAEIPAGAEIEVRMLSDLIPEPPQRCPRSGAPDPGAGPLPGAGPAGA